MKFKFKKKTKSDDIYLFKLVFLGCFTSCSSTSY